MPHVVPSQVIALIDRIFPGLAGIDAKNHNLRLDASQSVKISVIVDAVEEIPSELITLEGDDYAAFAASLKTLKHALDMWPSPGNTFSVNDTPGFSNSSPIILLRDSLAKCADDAPVKGTSELTFIGDAVFRDSLRLDISTSHTALINGEWKPATVIAGSVVEALLLWALQQKSQVDIDNAINNLISHGGLRNRPRNDLLEWNLSQFIEIARELNVISESTAQQCRIAKDFRNLIHPGRSERLGVRCSRGTAHSAIAAMEQVIEELQ
jgi:hypothetical protein